MSGSPDPSIQTYARLAGALFLLSMIAGVFGEVYVPSRLVVAGDAAATASNVTTMGGLLRMGFACYLVEALCDITLSWVLYVLLRPAHQNLALLAAFFALVGTAVFAGAELFFFGSSVILGGAEHLKSFSAEQVNSLGLLSLTFYAYGTGLFLVFYGAASVIRGYLIYRSGYLPRTIGALLSFGGVGSS